MSNNSRECVNSPRATRRRAQLDAGNSLQGPTLREAIFLFNIVLFTFLLVLYCFIVIYLG